MSICSRVEYFFGRRFDSAILIFCMTCIRASSTYLQLKTLKFEWRPSFLFELFVFHKNCQRFPVDIDQRVTVRHPLHLVGFCTRLITFLYVPYLVLFD